MRTIYIGSSRGTSIRLLTTNRTADIGLLWAGVSDAIRSFSTSAGPSTLHFVSSPSRRKLTPAQTLAVIDAGERFWTAGGLSDASPTGEQQY